VTGSRDNNGLGERLLLCNLLDKCIQRTDINLSEILRKLFSQLYTEGRFRTSLLIKENKNRPRNKCVFNRMYVSYNRALRDKIGLTEAQAGN
jgi:hypothetical protein